jgi:hypothetical protein
MSKLASGTAPSLIIAHCEDVGGMQEGIDVKESQSKGEVVVWKAKREILATFLTRTL